MIIRKSLRSCNGIYCIGIFMSFRNKRKVILLRTNSLITCICSKMTQLSNKIVTKLNKHNVPDAFCGDVFYCRKPTVDSSVNINEQCVVSLQSHTCTFSCGGYGAPPPGKYIKPLLSRILGNVSFWIITYLSKWRAGNGSIIFLLIKIFLN